jgi:hypothetical protein
MPDDELRYDKMVEHALRGVVRDALEVAARCGLPGDHHFYVTFSTHHPGVKIPGHILARHPDEMTIVLQHQFWGLDVGKEGFEVTLSFSGTAERLIIPFAAVTGFADPSAKFGLQFQVVSEGDLEEAEPPPAVAAEAKPAPAPGSEDGKVITLDAFRKK